MAHRYLATALLALLCVLPARSGQDSSNPQWAGIWVSREPPGRLQPLFSGSKLKVPVIRLRGKIADMPLTTPLVSQRLPRASIFVDNTGVEHFFGPNQPNGTNDYGIHPLVQKMFYIGGKPATLRLRPKAQKVPLKFLAGRCILLPIMSAQLTYGPKVKACELQPQ